MINYSQQNLLYFFSLDKERYNESWLGINTVLTDYNFWNKGSIVLKLR